MTVAEEGVAVGHALVRASGDAQNRLAPPDVGEREGQAVDRDPVAQLDEPLRFLRIPVGIRSPGEPPTVVTALGRPERGVRKDVLGTHFLSATESLEDGAAGKLVGPVAEHRPVRDLAGRRTPRADRIQDAA